MLKGKSKFTYDHFSDGYDNFAVSAQRYTKEQAIRLYIQEGYFDLNNVQEISVGRAYVRYGYGRNLDNDPCSCWWLEYKDTPRSCPVWSFHITSERSHKFDDGYEIIKLQHWI